MRWPPNAAVRSCSRRGPTAAAAVPQPARPPALRGATRAAVLTAGLSLGGNEGPGGGLVRGLVFDVGDRARTVDGAAIVVWGTGRGSRILDTTLRGHGRLGAGVAARRTEGLVMRRVVVRRFRDFGVLVDANDVDRAEQREPFAIRTSTSPASPGRAGIVEGASRGLRLDRRHRSVRRVRARSCAWSGLWTGTATRGRRFDAIDVDRAPTGVYIEHFTTDSTFAACGSARGCGSASPRSGPIPRGAAGPRAWRTSSRTAASRAGSSGVYLDEGTTRTTVRRSTFADQTWGAIGDYRGQEQRQYGNDTAARPASRHRPSELAREG